MKPPIFSRVFTLALAFALIIQVSQAQTFKLKTAAGVDSAVVTNVETKILKGAVKSYYPGASIQVTLDRTSGTVAGKVLLYGSNDGTNFVQIKSDSLVAINAASQSKLFDISPTKYFYYQTSYVQTGTAVVRMKSILGLKK